VITLKKELDYNNYGDTGVFCPLMSTGQLQRVPCNASCGWFFVGKNDHGECSLNMIAKYSHELSEKLG